MSPSLSNVVVQDAPESRDHLTIFAIAGGIIVLSAILNSVGAKIMGRVARFGVYVETIGTFGVFARLALSVFISSFGFVFSTQQVEYARAAIRSV